MSRRKKRAPKKSRRALGSELHPQTTKGPKRKIAERYRGTILLLSFVAVASFFHLYSSNIPDLDSFYYSRLAWIYRTRGPFDVDFPWAQYSASKTFSSSLWYGIGLFLVPFTYFNNLVIGIKLAGVVLTAAALWIYYSAIKISLLKPASLWPFLFFFSAANVTAQFLMVRPQIISLPLSALLFSLLIRRSEITDGPEFSYATASLTPIFLTSFGIAWFHLNFVWLPVVITCVVVVVRFIVEKKWTWLARWLSWAA